MEVRLLNSRVFFFLYLYIATLLLTACGDQLNINTEHGRHARIEEANFQLSIGNCKAALEAIDSLYNSTYVTDEIRVITASAYACYANFNLLTLISNLTGSTNYYKSVAKSMPNSIGDGKIAYMYQAIDILSSNNAVLNAHARGKDINTYMVFLQLGLVGQILAGYGVADADGNQTVALTYANPRVGADMSNLDACALSAAMSSIVDSYNNSNLSDNDTTAAKNSLNSACVSAGLASGCSTINRDRTVCTGVALEPNSVIASSVVGAINVAW